jgi:hypothetical protein
VLWPLPESDRWTNSTTRDTETCHEVLRESRLTVMFYLGWEMTGLLMGIFHYCTISCTIFVYYNWRLVDVKHER